MPLLRNNSKRLITVNTGDESFQIKPGDNPSVNLPDEAMNIPFVKHLVTHLIKSGTLIEVAARAVDVEAVDDTDDELAQLQAEALTLGMEFKDTWAASTLKGKIAKFKKEQADVDAE